MKQLDLSRASFSVLMKGARAFADKGNKKQSESVLWCVDEHLHKLKAVSEHHREVPNFPVRDDVQPSYSG